MSVMLLVTVKIINKRKSSNEPPWGMLGGAFLFSGDNGRLVGSNALAEGVLFKA
ncbi:MAG: hypothetical protein U9R58_13270 [Chloroflexota bacterium]|nr:hypothetical protein [Chloroflexota bacterium]